jgi:hypothetical protein
VFVIDEGDVLELQPGRVLVDRGQPDLDPADRAAELPRRAEGVRRLAPLDRPARVALQLESSADPQLTGDRQKPARDPRGIGARIPQVRQVRGVRAGENDRARLARLEPPSQPLTGGSHGHLLTPLQAYERVLRRDAAAVTESLGFTVSF